MIFWFCFRWNKTIICLVEFFLIFFWNVIQTDSIYYKIIKLCNKIIYWRFNVHQIILWNAGRKWPIFCSPGTFHQILIARSSCTATSKYIFRIGNQINNRVLPDFLFLVAIVLHNYPSNLINCLDRKRWLPYRAAFLTDTPKCVPCGWGIVAHSPESHAIGCRAEFVCVGKKNCDKSK